LAKVLVTGAAGKIGRALTAELVACGHEVVGLYRSKRGADAAVTWHQADVTSPESYAAALAGCDAVIHLAVDFRREMMDVVNVQATRDLLKAAHEAGVRYFGFASSVVVYGSPPRREVTEQTPTIDPAKPITGQYLAEPFMLDYARTKVEAERAIIANAAGMTIDIYRPTVVVTIPQLLESGDWGGARKAQIAHRNTQYITTVDVAAAIRHLMDRALAASPRGTAEIYNLADATSGTYAELLARAFAATGDSRFRVPLRLPALADRAKDFLKYRNLSMRTPLGRLKVSNGKLVATGFILPLGLERGVEEAIGRK